MHVQGNRELGNYNIFFSSCDIKHILLYFSVQSSSF